MKRRTTGSHPACWIKGAQWPEIDRLNQWLDEWGADPASTGARMCKRESSHTEAAQNALGRHIDEGMHCS